MYRSGSGLSPDVRKTVEKQRQFIRELRQQVEELSQRIETVGRPGASSDAETSDNRLPELARRIGLLNEQILRYASDLKLMYRTARARDQQLRASTVEVVKVLLNAVELRDPTSLGHGARIARIAVAMGRHLELDDGDLTTLQIGGLLHDVGYLAIDPALLGKPGKLTQAEFEEVRQHPELGAKIVSGLSALQSIVPIVLHHHERINGKGYPAGLIGDAIPHLARVVAVAEVFDALSTARPYREQDPLPVAIERIRRLAGRQLDRECVEAFLKAWAAGDLEVKPKS